MSAVSIVVTCLPDSPASISIQQRLRLDELLPISASLALKRVMRVANRFLIEFEQLAEIVDGEVTLGILSVVDNTRGEILL